MGAASPLSLSFSFSPLNPLLFVCLSLQKLAFLPYFVWIFLSVYQQILGCLFLVYLRRWVIEWLNSCNKLFITDFLKSYIVVCLIKHSFIVKLDREPIVFLQLQFICFFQLYLCLYFIKQIIVWSFFSRKFYIIVDQCKL